MNIPKYDNVSLLLMVEIAREYRHSYLSLADIAHKHRMSVLFLKKIAGTLKGAHLITSKEGYSGGYTLAKAPRDITLWDIIKPFSAQRSRSGDNQNLSKYCPLRKDCLPRKVHVALDNALKRSFNGITLSQLTG